MATLPRPRLAGPAPLINRLRNPAELPGLYGEADGDVPHALPWGRLLPPLEVPDAIGPLPLVPDPEALRLARGEVAYLGYWLPRESLAEMWHGSQRPARFVLRPGQAEVWTDLVQFRGEVLSATGRLYTLVADYLDDADNREAVLPPLGETRLRAVPCRLVVVGPRPGVRESEAEPVWVQQAVAPNRQLVVATDLRSPEALVVPLVRGIMRATLEASYGEAAPAWLKEAWARELARGFARHHRVAEWERLERALDLDRIAVRQAAASLPADFFVRELDTEADRAVAWALWRALPAQELAPLLAAVSARDPEALQRENERLAALARGQATDTDTWSRHLERFIHEQSQRLREEVELSPSHLAVLTPAHLAPLLLQQPTDAHHPASAYFAYVTGYLDESSPTASPSPAGLAPPQAPFERLNMSHYSMRELTALLGLGARLRLIHDEHRRADAVRAELTSLFAQAGRDDWLHWLTKPQESGSDATGEQPAH